MTAPTVAYGQREHLLPVQSGTSLRQPARVRDLRKTGAAKPKAAERQAAEERLVFPPRSVLLLAGIPGAGKTTLLRRLYALTGREESPVPATDGALVLDSEHARNWWARWLRHIPYPCWRPLVHLTHFRRLWAAMGRTEPIVLHECGTRDWLFRRIVRHAERHGRQVHVVLLDVPVPVARQAQRDRGRQVHAIRFDRHGRRWQAMLAMAETDPSAVLEGAVSVTVIDRDTASRLTAVEFGGDASRATSRPCAASARRG